MTDTLFDISCTAKPYVWAVVKSAWRFEAMVQVNSYPQDHQAQFYISVGKCICSMSHFSGFLEHWLADLD